MLYANKYVNINKTKKLILNLDGWADIGNSHKKYTSFMLHWKVSSHHC